MEGAGSPRGGEPQPASVFRIRSASVAVVSRFGTIDWEFGGEVSFVLGGQGSRGSSLTLLSSITEVMEEEISPSVGKVRTRSGEIVIYR